MRAAAWAMALLVGAGAGAWGCAARQEEPASMARARELLRTAEAPRGDVVLRCEPSEAEVYLDGVIQGLCSDFAGTPVGLKLGERLHRIDVKQEGYWPYTTYFEAGGTRATLRVQLRPRESGAGGAP